MSENDHVSIRINGKEPGKNKKEVAATEENSKDFHWVLPEQIQVQKNQKSSENSEKKIKNFQNGQAPRLPLRRKKRPFKATSNNRRSFRGSSKNRWLSGIFAVVVGVIMGLIVLSIFTQPPHQKISGSMSLNQKSNPTISATANTPETLPAAKSLNLSLQVIQGGAFSSDANGKTAQKKLQNHGFAGVLRHHAGEVYLYIGVGNNKNEAEKIANLYKHSGQDVWVKSFSIHVNKSKLDNKTISILREAKPLMTELIKESDAGLADGKSKGSLKTWNQIQTQIHKLNTNQTNATTKMVEQLNDAANEVGKFRSHSEKSELWDAQQSLLNAMDEYIRIGS